MAKLPRKLKTVRPQYLFLLALALGWIFDFLFWKKSVGISLPIFTFLIVITGLWMARRAGLKASPKALWLLVPIAFFAWVPVFRIEPFTRFTSIALVFLLLALFSLSYLGGQWIRYGFLDYIVRILGLVPTGLGLLREPAAKPARKTAGSGIRSLAPVFRGLLFALPLLWFLAVLLASADPAFGDWLENLFSFLQIENAVELLWRGFIILILGYVMAAAYLVAFNKSRKQKLFGEDAPIAAPILGFGETVTMLTAVNILFAAFVVFQFNYFFGGTTNIVDTPTGFTYSQYAVRGFWELVIVAMTSLGFFVLLSAAGRKETNGQQKWFSGLGIALFALVAVILASAFERLLLYERVYGFTRMRTYPHVFMIWLGLLLLAVVILEATARQRAFALATLLAVAGFSASLALVNVDGMITRENIGLIRDGQSFQASIPEERVASLDYAYLGTLSDDAVPELVASYRQASADGNSLLTQKIATALTCHFEVIENQADYSWQSWNWSRQTARDLWSRLNTETGFQVIEITGNSFIVNGEELSCYGLGWD